MAVRAHFRRWSCARQGGALRRLARLAALGLLAWLVAGCTLPGPADPPATDVSVPPDGAIYVARYTWHSKLIVPSEAVTAAGLPKLAELGDGAWTEMGWGDALYYPGPDGFRPLALAHAIAWPGASVTQVHRFDGSPEAVLPAHAIQRVPASGEGIAAVAHHLAGTPEMPEAGEALAPVAPGHYGNANFYPANGIYLILRNSNQWTAHGLRRLGCPDIGRPLTADAVMTRAAACAEAGAAAP